jgi:hypothetical protein
MIWTKATCKLISIKEQAASTKASSPCPLPLPGLPAENMVNPWRILHLDNEQYLTATLCQPELHTVLNCLRTQFVSKKRQFHCIVLDLNNSEVVSWIGQRIEVVFIAKCRSPASITNAAVVEAVTPSPEGEDEVTGKDDSVEVFWVRRQTGLH